MDFKACPGLALVGFQIPPVFVGSLFFLSWLSPQAEQLPLIICSLTPGQMCMWCWAKVGDCQPAGRCQDRAAKVGGIARAVAPWSQTQPAAAGCSEPPRSPPGSAIIFEGHMDTDKIDRGLKTLTGTSQPTSPDSTRGLCRITP